MKQLSQSSTSFALGSSRLLVVVGELFQCSLPGRNRLSQLYLVLSDCLIISLSQLFGGTGVCSWSLLVCVTVNPPKEGPLEALGGSTLTLD